MHAMGLNAYERPPEFEPVPEPECGAEDLVLEVLACGVCATDLKIVRGDVPSVTLPHIPGHEIAGAVAEVGGDAEDRFKRGETACCYFFVPCNSCNNCRRGHINVCELLAGGDGAGRLGFELQGAYAQVQIAPSRGAHVIAVDRGEKGLGLAATFGAREVIDAVSFPADADGLKVDKVIDFAGVLDAVVAGEVQPVVSARFPLEAANEALDHVARGERPGRTVLDLRRDRSTSGADKRVPVAV